MAGFTGLFDGRAAAAEPTGLLVSPARIDARVRAGDPLPPITVTNGTDKRLTVDVAAVPARQDLSGLPVYDLSDANVRTGRQMLRVSPRRLRLAPGARRNVSVIVGRPIRPEQVGVYAVVTFTGRETQAPGEQGAVVAPTIRLATNLLLRYPGRAVIDASATALRAEQAPRRTLRFFARIRNDGNLHTRPRARLTIRSDGDDERLLRRPFRGENVLPDAERELSLDITQLLPAGVYRARVDARVAGRRSSREIRFRLVGPNELPTANLSIVSLQTPQPDAGESFNVVVGLENAGTAPITPAGTITLMRSGERDAAIRQPLRPGTLAAGKRDELTVRLPGVRAGSYTITARFADGPQVLAERTVVFQTDIRPSLLDRILDWMASHIPVLLGGFAALLALVAGGLLAYIRRLRRRSRLSHLTDG